MCVLFERCLSYGSAGLPQPKTVTSADQVTTSKQDIVQMIGRVGIMCGYTYGARTGGLGVRYTPVAKDNFYNRKAPTTALRYRLKHAQVEIENVPLTIHQNWRYNVVE